MESISYEINKVHDNFGRERDPDVLDFSQLHVWHVDSFWTLKGSSALVQLMLELLIHCRISCSFI